jgi:uncharacterized membrane protein YdjX (TVP38/TMEM64 family)
MNARSEDPATHTRRRLWRVAMVLLVLLGLSAAWRWSPLSEWLRPELLVASLRSFGAWLGPLGSLMLMALALSLAVPLVLLTLVSMLALGPLWGSLCLSGAALLAATLTHLLGRALGHALLLSLAGPRLLRLSQALEARGLLAVIALRLVPVAPFAIVNMAAGATHLRLRDMLLGTAIGMLPGTLAIALFSEQILQALQSPNPTRYGLLAITAALIAAGAWGLKRWLAAQTDS